MKIRQFRSVGGKTDYRHPHLCIIVTLEREHHNISIEKRRVVVEEL
jgi:hypothetical protein